ncbi:transposase [Streptomyces sp. NBC_01635]|nr:transposase [Streptomyces sp. NBC_01635]
MTTSVRSRNSLARFRAEGHEIRDEDIARLSPLKLRNLNVLGRYSFTVSVPREELRPLRDPDAVELDDDDDGGDRPGPSGPLGP